jgi:hypothetical protein
MNATQIAKIEEFFTKETTIPELVNDLEMATEDIVRWFGYTNEEFKSMDLYSTFYTINQLRRFLVKLNEAETKK